MLLGHQIIQIVGFVAIVLDVIVFRNLLGMPYVRLPFVIAAFALFMHFYLCTSKFYSERTAKKLEKRCPGSIRNYKSNLLYFVESVLAIVILLIPITILLYTMRLNQLEIYEVSFWMQCIIAGLGLPFISLISAVFKIGPTYTIGYSAAAQRAAQTAAANKQRQS